MSRKQIYAMAGGILLLSSAGLGMLARACHQMIYLKGALAAIVFGMVLFYFSDKAAD